jgi:hypothetical protein
MTFNLFGATVAGVLRNFQTGSYTPASADFGGDDAILDVLGEMEGTLLDAMPPRLFQTMAGPDLLRAVVRATAGQTTFTLPEIFRPLQPNTIHLWRGWPATFQDRPKLRTSPDYSDAYEANNSNPSRIRYSPTTELDADAFSVNVSTGIVTLTEALQADFTVFASFGVDVGSADYGVPSLARILEMGAAGEIGARVYSRATDEWSLVEGFRSGFAAAVEATGKGERIPPEIRVLQWWQEVEKSQENRLGSVRMFRG